MRQTVTVLSVSGGKTKVAYDRPTACHNDCSKCEGGCGAMTAKERVIVPADNPIGAVPGDRVVIEAETKAVYTAILLVYALPLVLFFAGYFGGESRNLSGVVTGIAGFFLGLVVAVLTSRSKTKHDREIRFRIVGFAESARADIP